MTSSKVTTVTLHEEQQPEEHSLVPLITAETAGTQELVLHNRLPIWRKKYLPAHFCWPDPASTETIFSLVTENVVPLVVGRSPF